VAIRRGIEQTIEAITREPNSVSKPVTGPMIAQVGTISANHADSIGRVIAEAIEKVDDSRTEGGA
jgi:chaperonin GroEL